MQEIELSQGEFSNPPPHDDVSDYTSSDFPDSDIDDNDYDMHSNHDSPIQTKWAEKTIQVVGDLVGDPLDPIWQTSMQEEFNSLQENETWELVPFPSKRKLVQ